jgi:hypothetical protein
MTRIPHILNVNDACNRSQLTTEYIAMYMHVVGEGGCYKAHCSPLAPPLAYMLMFYKLIMYIIEILLASVIIIIIIT